MPHLKHLFGIVLLFALAPVFAEENMHAVSVTGVVLEIPRTIRVTAINHEGKPLADTDVFLLGNDQWHRKEMSDYPLLMQAKTDSEGKCAFPLTDDWFDGSVKIRSVELRVQAEEYAHLSIGPRKWQIGSVRPQSPIVVPEENVISFEGVLQAVARLPATPPKPVGEEEISGRIVDEQGRPVAGATVYVSGERRYTEHETATDDEGRYHLQGLYDSDQILIVTKAGMQRDVRVVKQSELGKTHDIALSEGRTIKIRVLRENGEPLAGVAVSRSNDALDLGKFRWQGLNDPLSVTDENGYWEWNEAPAEAVGYSISTSRLTRIDSRGKNTMTVYAIEGGQSHDVTLSPRETPHEFTAVEHEVSPARTTFFGTAPNYPVWKSAKKLTVRVFDENFEPLAGALVEPCSSPGKYYHDKIAVEEPFSTNENGIVSFDFSDGDLSDISNFWIVVSAEGYETAEWFDTYWVLERGFHDLHSVNYKTLPETVNVILSPKDKIVGRVCDVDGNPVEGATVVLTNDMHFFQEGQPPHRRYGNLPDIKTDADGIWSADVSSDIAKKLHAAVSKDGYFPQCHILEPFRRNTVLKKSKKLSVRIVDENGRPLEGVTVDNLDDHTRPRLGTTDSQGEFRWKFAAHYEGTIRFRLNKQGLPHRIVEIDSTGETENLQWELNRGESLRVRFVPEGLPEGQKIPDHIVVTVYERRLQGNVRGSQIENVPVGDDGLLVIENAPRGTFGYGFLCSADSWCVTEKIRYLLASGDDEHVVKLVPRKPEPKSAPNDHAQETPYGRIDYRALRE